MTTTSIMTIDELDGQQIELLPIRETMALINFNMPVVIGVNLAFAINAATINSTANATAAQVLASVQY